MESRLSTFIIISNITLIISFIQSGYIPASPSLYGAKSIASYTAHVIGANILTLIGNQGDKLITGKMLGFYDLGLYNRAFASANLAVQNIKSVVTEVSFPSLSLINTDEKRLKKNFLKMLRYLSIIGFPVSIFLIVLAKEFILTLYGPKWERAIMPLQILSVMSLRRIVGSPASTLFNAKGKPHIMLRFGMFFTPVYIIAVFMGTAYGIIGVSVSVTLLRTIGGLIIFYLLANELNIRFLQIFSPMTPALKISLLSGVSLFILKWLVHIKSPSLSLIVWGITGGIIYVTLLLTHKELRNDILELIKFR